MKKLRVPVFACVLLAALSATRGVSQEPAGRAELDAAFSKGQALRKQGKHAEAIPFLEKAAALAPKVHGPDHLETANILFALGNSYRSVGRPREAEPPYRRVAEIREARLGKDHLKVAESLGNLAVLYQELARYKAAAARGSGARRHRAALILERERRRRARLEHRSGVQAGLYVKQPHQHTPAKVMVVGKPIP
jgi:tetratricopeptide (TPR) repeat protein